jgi:putative salt-induced outer membrane protein YdiY
MRKLPLAVLAGPLLFLGTALAAHADVIFMSNGDRISGKVSEVSDGTLTIGTDYAGTIRISWEKVSSVETEQPVLIRLTDDTLVSGRIVATADGKFKFQEEGQPAPREIPKSEVFELNRPGVHWHGDVTLAGKVENGNSNSKNLFLKAEIVMDSENYRAVARTNAAREKTDGVLTEDNYFALLKLDRHLSLSSFAYISDEALRDRFEDLQFRNVTSVGLGYTLAKLEGLSVWIEAGPAIMVERLSDGSDDTWGGARAGVHAAVSLPLGLELRDDFVYWANLERWVNWQLHNEVTLSSRILSGVHVSFAIITDIDNEPSAGRKSTDNTFLIGISHKF